MFVNEDILWKITSYLEPDLPLLVRLAAVNRTFYTVFTSDSLWERYNPYGAEKGIFISFRNVFQDLDAKLLRYYWVNGDRGNNPLTYSQLRTLTQNHFVWLGYLLVTFINAEHFTDEPALIECGADLLYKSGYPNVEPEFMQTSKEWAIKLLSINPGLLRHCLPDEYIHDKTIIAAMAVGKVINYDLEPSLSMLKEDQRSGGNAELALKHDARNIKYVDENLRKKFASDKKWVMKVVERMPELMEFCPEQNDDKEVVAQMFTQTPKVALDGGNLDCLQYASDRLRSDYAVCKLAIDFRPKNLLYSLVNDTGLLKSALARIEKIGYFRANVFTRTVLRQVYGERVAEDKSISVMIAKCAGSRLEHTQLCSNFWEDEDAVLAVFENPINTTAMEGLRLPDRYALNPDFIMKVMDNGDPFIWKFLRKEVKEHPDVALKGLKLGVPLEQAEEFVGPIFSTNRELVKLSAELTPPTGLFKTPARFSDDLEILEIAVRKRGCALKYASSRLQSNKALVLKAFDAQAHVDAGAVCPCAPFKWVSPILLQDKPVLEELVQAAFTCPQKHLNRETALIVFKNFPDRYRYIPVSLKEDVDFNVEAAKVNAATLRFMPGTMWLNERVVQTANFEFKSKINTFCGECFE